MQKKTQILLWMVIAMIISYLPWYNFSAVNGRRKNLKLTIEREAVAPPSFTLKTHD